MLPAPTPWPYIADFTRPEGATTPPTMGVILFTGSRHCALFELLTQRPNHTIAATTPHPLNASALAQSVAMPVSHGTFQPCAGMSVASVFSFIGRSQPNNYSACRFHTAHRQAPCSGLTFPCRNAVAYIWYGIAVLPCFSASGKVPVTCCGLPLRGTYAVYVQFPLRLSHAHARLRPRKHFKRFHQSRQGGRIPTRSFQQALSFSVRRSAYSHIIRELPGLSCRW